MPKTTPKLNQTAQTRGSTAWAYVLADAGNGLPDGILIGSSREVHRWIDVDEHRKAGGI
ncbi:MAG: hypothetical protein HC837_04140 [Chloroflexaceae bacterium]|nr:hypothetical protein [Chloroflexaceae bacterium]